MVLGGDSIIKCVVLSTCHKLECGSMFSSCVVLTKIL